MVVIDWQLPSTASAVTLVGGTWAWTNSEDVVKSVVELSVMHEINLEILDVFAQVTIVYLVGMH